MVQKNKIDFSTFDMETNTSGKVLGIGLMVKELDEYYEFDNVEKFIKFTLYHKLQILYAHAGGRFDFLFLIHILKNYYNLKCITQGSSAINVKFQHIEKSKKYTFELRDSFALFPASLDKLTGSKGKVDYKKFDNPEYWNKVGRPYLENDVRILHNTLIKYYKWCNDLDLKVHLTVAKNSTKLFFSKFCKYKLHETKKMNDFVRLYYFGGRVDTFIRRYTTKRLFSFDVNWLYPFVMKNNLFPVSKFYRVAGFYRPKKNEICMYYGRLTLKKHRFINLPVLYGEGSKKKLFFCYGNIKGLFFQPEFDLAEKYGLIENNNIMYTFVANADYVFRDYITFLEKWRYHYKRKGDLFLEQVYKYFGNSLYGKFAMKSDKIMIETSPTYQKIRNGLKTLSVEYDVYYKDVHIEYEHEDVPISAFTTSYGRAYMAEEMTKLYNMGIMTWYLDTDGIKTRKRIPESWIDEMKMGKYKLEDKLDESYFPFPKFYFYKNEKGEYVFRTKGISIDNKKDFFKYLDGEKLPHKSLLRPLKSSLKDKKKFLSYNHIVMKQLRETELKRIFDKNGNSEPYYMEM